MVSLSRREFLAAASALLISRSVAAAPARLARKDCFFGLHFDLHPTAEDAELGRDLTEEMVANLLESCRPDFVQYDSKGHPGYLGFPSKTGMSAPGIVQDSLAIWRRVTAAYGVALYNHFSGVLDGLALSKHPDWARVGPDGKPDPQETSLFSSYERELMIPELTEAALKYDLDGSWVDGDCWAVRPDYGDAVKREFLEKTGLEGLPKQPGDKGWTEFLEMQRAQFRQYVAQYVEALHRTKPGYQIGSNWMYSTFMPERPTLPLDFLSGDLAEQTVVQQARVEARYLSRVGKPWDLMSWGFEKDEQAGNQSNKPAVQLQQEAAIVLAQGGAYQVYCVPTRAGWIDNLIVRTAAEVARFCRKRQQWCHGSQTLPEVGIFFSGHTLYRTSDRLFGEWRSAEIPAIGAVDLLLACGYSVDLIPDWQLEDCAAQYPVIVVPDWQDIGAGAVRTLIEHVSAGGKLLLCGAENAGLFASELNLRLTGAAQKQTYLVADESGFAQITGKWIEMEGVQEGIVANAYRAPDTRKGIVPLAARVNHGKGSVVVCPGPITTAYGNASAPMIRSVVRRLMESLLMPMVTLSSDDPALEIVLRRKNGQVLIHFINSAGASETSEFRNTGVVPPIGPTRLRLRIPKAPSRIVLEPGGTSLTGEYRAGQWHGELPRVYVHSIVRVEGGV